MNKAHVELHDGDVLAQVSGHTGLILSLIHISEPTN